MYRLAALCSPCGGVIQEVLWYLAMVCRMLRCASLLAQVITETLSWDALNAHSHILRWGVRAAVAGHPVAASAAVGPGFIDLPPRDAASRGGCSPQTA